MRIWQGIDSLPQDWADCAVAIGVFDGVHTGHAELLALAVERARTLGIPAVMVTFDPHPAAVLGNRTPPGMLSSIQFRARRAELLGIDDVLVLHFDKDTAAQSPESFMVDTLAKKLKAKVIVTGENFTFGYRAAGTVELLKEFGWKEGVEVDTVPLLQSSGLTVSSTSVRTALSEGNIDEAITMLGHLPRVEGVVVRGQGRGGSELGYPTANLDFDPRAALPSDGIYAGWFSVIESGYIEGTMRAFTWYQAAVSVGSNPTFDGEHRTFEAFVLDQDSQLYGKLAAIELVGRIRDMEKFHSVSELLTAMKHDVATARALFESSTIRPTGFDPL